MTAAEPVFDEPDSPPSEENVENPMAIRGVAKWLILILSLVVADATLYRGKGYGGIGLFAGITPALWSLLYCKPRYQVRTLIVIAMILLVSVRLLMCGFWLQPLVGGWLLVVYAMLLTGRTPHILESFQYATQAPVAGFALFQHRSFRLTRDRPHALGLAGMLSVILPLLAVVVFGFLFVLANPNLMKLFGDNFEVVLRSIREWLVEYGPEPLEIAFLVFMLLLTAGLIRPINRKLDMLELEDEEIRDDDRPPEIKSILYPAYRNTLIAVAVLFAVYIVFEFQTLWFRSFPEGFHYSGYAHEGAFWLTVALALSTLTLSVIFRRDLLRDERIVRLKRLAWIWSAQNFLLALAVYHRLSIYVGFNGMTRMRVVGFFGISAVVCGFALVVWKIAQHLHFLQLVRRQMWVLALFVYLYAVFPVDHCVMTYNVNRILSGDPAPSVQISEHPIDDEGIDVLFPLLEADDEIIRDGVKALLSARYRQEVLEAGDRRRDGWTAWSWSHNRLLNDLRKNEERLHFPGGEPAREAAWNTFDAYAYQWY